MGSSKQLSKDLKTNKHFNRLFVNVIEDRIFFFQGDPRIVVAISVFRL